MSAPRVLVLAGLDPSGRAGLLADGEAVRGLGAEPVLCATAIAAQSGRRLVLAEPVSRAALEAQVEGALEDGELGAVKIGMLGRPELLEALAALLEGPLAAVPAVLDPVLETSRGGALYAGPPADFDRLLARVALVTPNLGEAARLSGIRVVDEASMLEAAQALAARGARAVLLKGGHLVGAPADLLWAEGRARWLRGERIAGSRRGTGCRLASAIAAGLARGRGLEPSVEGAVAYVRAYLAGGLRA